MIIQNLHSGTKFRAGYCLYSLKAAVLVLVLLEVLLTRDEEITLQAKQTIVVLN